MKNYSSEEIEFLHTEYENILPLLENIATRTKDEISSLLESLNASLSHPLQGRIKSWDSIREKLGRGEVEIKKIWEMQDLIGFRVVVLFIRDVGNVGDAISRSFHVIKAYNTKAKLGDDKFGYLSTHYVIGLSDDALVLDEYSISNLMIEIQVRTLSQHLWAETSHSLSYKREESIPLMLRRELNQTAAILETVDSSFERILSQRENYLKGIVDLETDSTLDVDILQVTLDALWPLENKLEKEPYEYLLYHLIKNGIDTQKKLTNLIRKYRDDVIKRSAREAEYLRNLIKTHPPINGTIKIVSPNKVHTRSNITPELIEKVGRGIFYGHVALTGTALQFETGERNPLEPLD